MIMHAHLDTDIREGIERERVGYNARAIVGFVPILPLVSEKIAFSRGASRMRRRREPKRFPLSSLFTRETLSRRRRRTEALRASGYRQKYPNYSKRFEGERSSILWFLPIWGSRERRQTVQRAIHEIPLDSSFERGDSRWSAWDHSQYRNLHWLW